MVTKTKEWIELVAIAAKQREGKTVQDGIILGNILTAPTREIAAEWFAVAMLATHTDAVVVEAGWLVSKSKQIEALPEAKVWAELPAAIRALVSVMNTRLEKRIGASAERVLNLLRRLKGEELPS